MKRIFYFLAGTILVPVKIELIPRVVLLPSPLGESSYQKKGKGVMNFLKFCFAMRRSVLSLGYPLSVFNKNSTLNQSQGQGWGR